MRAASAAREVRKKEDKMKRWLYCLVSLILAVSVRAAQVQFDLSGGFNTDNIIGPKEYQAVVTDTQPPTSGTKDLKDLQGSWDGAPVLGIQAYYAVQQQYQLVANSSTEQYAITNVYPYNNAAGWVGQNPIGTPAKEGIKEDGTYTGGSSRVYHIASFGGNATYPGDWTEANPVTYTSNTSGSMNAKPNAMSLMCNHANTYQVSNIVATLPVLQQGNYSDINFVIGGWQQSKRALNCRIIAVYDDGEETLFTFNTNTAVAAAQAVISDAVGNTDAAFIALDKMTQAYNSASGVPGAVINNTNTLYEFSAPLPLNGSRTLIGIKLVDINPALKYNARGVTLFGATATEAVSGAPIAVFSADPVTGSMPLTVTFADTSTGTITNRFWDFGDGSTTNTTAIGLTHTYVSTGTYTVALTVSGDFGSDTNTQADLITATPATAPATSFSTDTNAGVRPLLVTFTDTSTGTITNRYWDFGDGTTMDTLLTSVQHSYSATGVFSVALTASGPVGSDTDTQADLITVTNSPPVMWNGAGTNNYWNTVANWVGGAKPNFNATAGFSGDAGATPNPDLNGAAITGIGIDFQSAGWTISDTVGGGSLRIDAGLSLSSVGAGINHFAVDIGGSGTTPILVNIGAGNTVQISKGFAQSRYNFGSSDGTLVFDGSVLQGNTGSTTTTTPDMTILANTTGGGAWRYSNLESYGRVGGTGTVQGYQYGTSRFYAGAVLAPGGNGIFGAEIGTLSWTCNTNAIRHNIEFESGSIFEAQIGAAPGSNDKLLYETYGGGQITLKAGAILNLLSDGAIQDGTYTIMENATTNVVDIAGTFTTVNYNGTEADSNNITVSYLGDSIVVNVTGLSGSVPPPASVLTFGAHGAGQDVIHWTTAQGSGYVYGVYYSTNLLNGFQPLETGLSDTVTSITNTISASPVFYKIEAQ